MQVNDFPMVDGAPGTTKRVVAGSTAAELPDEIKYQNGQVTGIQAKSVVIYIESATIRFAYGDAPVPGTPFGYPLAATNYVILDKWEEINTIQVIRESGTDADLTVTSYF